MGPADIPSLTDSHSFPRPLTNYLFPHSPEVERVLKYITQEELQVTGVKKKKTQVKVPNLKCTSE